MPLSVTPISLICLSLICRCGLECAAVNRAHSKETDCQIQKPPTRSTLAQHPSLIPLSASSTPAPPPPFVVSQIGLTLKVSEQQSQNINSCREAHRNLRFSCVSSTAEFCRAVLLLLSRAHMLLSHARALRPMHVGHVLPVPADLAPCSPEAP